MTLIVMFINILKTMEIKNAAHCPINDKDLCLDELVRDLFNDGQYSWNKDNTEMVGFVGTNGSGKTTTIRASIGTTGNR